MLIKERPIIPKRAGVSLPKTQRGKATVMGGRLEEAGFGKPHTEDS